MNDDIRDDEIFWMVWNPERSAPTHRHVTEHSAEAEAERLARICPGQRFYVLQATCFREVAEPIRRVKLELGIPF